MQHCLAAHTPTTGAFKIGHQSPTATNIQNRPENPQQRTAGNAVITVRDATGAQVGAATVSRLSMGQPLSQKPIPRDS
jgi:hypothetical protein